MKNWKTTLSATLLICWYALLFMALTCFISLAIANDFAYRGAIDEETLDEIVECGYEEVEELEK